MEELKKKICEHCKKTESIYAFGDCEIPKTKKKLDICWTCWREFCETLCGYCYE